MEYMHICISFDAGLAVYYGIMLLSLYQEDGVGGCFTWTWRCKGAFNVKFWVFGYLDVIMWLPVMCNMLIMVWAHYATSQPAFVYERKGRMALWFFANVYSLAHCPMHSGVPPFLIEMVV
jgi:hypothetical protein